MAIPTFYQLLTPILKELSLQEKCEFAELTKRLSIYFKLSESEINKVSLSGKNVFANRIGWARTYLMKAGLITTHNKQYIKITDIGKKVVQLNLENINYVFLKKFKNFREFKHLKPDNEPTDNI